MIVFTITDTDGGVETLRTSRTKLTVGGAYTDDITLPGGNVSPEHGVFNIEGKEVVYTDNGLGTFINDREIVGETVPLAPEDAVRIGEFVISYTPEREDSIPASDPIPSGSSFTWRTPSQKPGPESFPLPNTRSSEMPPHLGTTSYPTYSSSDAEDSEMNSPPESYIDRSVTSSNDDGTLKKPEENEKTNRTIAIIIWFIIIILVRFCSA
jgi:pSer/pThr/pTyr-binding forkhead associated (FHA) protein